MNGNKIPLTVGITGHLNLRENDLEILRAAVKRELDNIRKRCPHTPVILLCSLARGADLLCADCAEEAGIPLRAVLPMEQAEYEKDFSPADLARFRHHLERAEPRLRRNRNRRRTTGISDTGRQAFIWRSTAIFCWPCGTENGKAKAAAAARRPFWPRWKADGSRGREWHTAARIIQRWFIL